MIKRPIGEVLREARHQAKLRLDDVVRITENEISNPYLSQLETGHSETPSPHKLRALSEALNVSYPHLLFHAGYLTLSEFKTFLQFSRK